MPREKTKQRLPVNIPIALRAELDELLALTGDTLTEATEIGLRLYIVQARKRLAAAKAAGRKKGKKA